MSSELGAVASAPPVSGWRGESLARANDGPAMAQRRIAAAEALIMRSILLVARVIGVRPIWVVDAWCIRWPERDIRARRTATPRASAVGNPRRPSDNT